MNNQKNRFWTFCFSLVPGAGEMYFGMYHCGSSLMLCFFLVMMVPLALEAPVFSVLAVILWFYSFLHVHNLRAMPVEEFQALEDRYVWEGYTGKLWTLEKHRTVIAIVLIVVGGYMLLQSVLRFLPWSFYHQIVYYMPRLIVSVLIIALGVWLIQGQKQKLTEDEPERPLSAPAEPGGAPTAETAAPGEAAAVPAAVTAEEPAEESREVPHESA